jgi:hypothetical protein
MHIYVSIICKENGVTPSQVIADPDTNLKPTLIAQAKVQPGKVHEPGLGPYSRMRPGGYGQASSSSQAAARGGPYDKAAPAGPALALSGPTQPKHAPAAHMLADSPCKETMDTIEFCEGWNQKCEPEPLCMCVEIGEQKAGVGSLESTLSSWFELDQPINALMDAQVGSIYSPITGAVMGNEPIWKSDKGFYLWKHVDGDHADGDKDCATGWHVSSQLWTDDIKHAEHDVLT